MQIGAVAYKIRVNMRDVLIVNILVFREELGHAKGDVYAWT